MTEIDKAAGREARHVASQIRQGMRDFWKTIGLVRRAWTEEHWKALGYPSWQAYTDNEFGSERVGLPAEHREKAIAVLRLDGMSTRAIGAVVGVSHTEVGRTLRSGGTDVPPEAAPPQVKGTDGKAYASTKPVDPVPAAIAEQIERRIAERVSPEAATEEEVDEPSVDGPNESIPTVGSGPAPSPAYTGEGVTPDPEARAAEYMARFSAALMKAGGWMQFDPERVAQNASPTTWDAIEAHAEVVAHTFERMRKARRTLRVVPGGAA